MQQIVQSVCRSCRDGKHDHKCDGIALVMVGGQLVSLRACQCACEPTAPSLAGNRCPVHGRVIDGMNNNSHCPDCVTESQARTGLGTMSRIHDIMERGL